MELSGTIAENLRAAIASAKRFRGQRVHSDTFEFWAELLAAARRKLNRPGAKPDREVEQLVQLLGNELADRDRVSQNL